MIQKFKFKKDVFVLKGIQEGLNQKQISDKYDLYQPTVSRYIRRYIKKELIKGMREGRCLKYELLEKGKKELEEQSKEIIKRLL